MLKIKGVVEEYGRMFLSLVFLFTGTSFIRGADDDVWPKVIKRTTEELTVYQPQPESLDGTDLSARAAVSIKLKDSNRPIFGAVWITTTLDVDRITRIAILTNIKIPSIKFSDDLDSAATAKYRKLIEEEIPKWNYEVSVDDIIATLEATTNVSRDKFNNDPPEIIIARKPSILVLIDGDPIMNNLEGYDYKRILNSAFFIINDPAAKQYYLYGDKFWYSASLLKGKWSQVKNPSSSLVKLQGEIEKAMNDQSTNQAAAEPRPSNVIPEVVLRTTPAELIVFDGEPEFSPIQGTNLLFVKNSENDVFIDIKSQSYFILISGRWYSSKVMDGPWTYIDAEKLPEDFAKIPEGSQKDAALASVPGTSASREAILDSQIPQTAEVDRKTATVTVEYDGEPKFEKVDGTTMLYAVNTPQTVLKLPDKYYCVDNGIWFESSSPRGVWEVAEKRPEAVENIEPSSPVYNVKYVYVYNVTPTVVYVGYTPGYYGCYAYGPTVIYGTGYYYYPWYGTYYYPRPVTYGYYMTYNPYTGWGIGVGVSYGGWYHVSYGHGYHGGYWGPPAYRPPYHHHHPGGYYGHAGRPVHYNNVNININNNNIYAGNRQGVKPGATKPSGTYPATAKKPVSSGGNNNVYTDKNGKVYQKTNNGWQTRQGNDWKPADNKTSTGTSARPATGTATKPETGGQAKPSTGSTARQPSAAPTQPSFDKSSMDRASQNRDRGAARTTNYHDYAGSSKSTSRSAQPKSSTGGSAPRRK